MYTKNNKAVIEIEDKKYIISAYDIVTDVRFRDLREGGPDYDYAPGDASGIFDDDLQKAIKGKFGVNVDFDYDTHYDEVLSVWLDRTEETSPKNAEEIVEFCNQWIAENAEYWIVDAIEYFDGSNKRSLIHDPDGETSGFDYVDDEEAEAILSAYDKASFDYEQRGNWLMYDGARQDGFNLIRTFNDQSTEWIYAMVVSDAEFDSYEWTETPEDYND